jgi:hypothetical protein
MYHRGKKNDVFLDTYEILGAAAMKIQPAKKKAAKKKVVKKVASPPMEESITSEEDEVEFYGGDEKEFDLIVQRRESRTYSFVPKGNKKKIEVSLDENGGIIKVFNGADMTDLIEQSQKIRIQNEANELREQDRKMLEYMQSDLYQNLYTLGEGDENQLPDAKKLLIPEGEMQQYIDDFPKESIEILPYIKMLAQAERVIFDQINQAIIAIMS